MARDGTVVFPESGANGGSMLTANGVEYQDRRRVPERVISRDPNEPWRAPIGFILPRDGVFRETSRPTVLATTGLAIVLRPSDTRVPSWGGEVLVRVDVLAPAAEGTARWGENVALIVDGEGEDTLRLADVALAQLAGRDRVTVIDARGARIALPLVPATNRSMANAALEKRFTQKPRERGASQLASALALASASLQKPPRSAGAATTKITSRIVILTSGASDPYAPPLVSELQRLARAGVRVAAIASSGSIDESQVGALTAWGGGTTGSAPEYEARAEAIREAIPAAGDTMFRDVRLTFEGVPAPSHVLEATGGDVRWRLDAGELALGDIRAGEARTEILRVTVPAWTPGESFHFTVTATVDEPSGRRSFAARLPCVYDNDVDRIARSRHGDVIAYASAMATLRRLDAAFVGAPTAGRGGLLALAQLHARSMALLARDMRDPVIAEQAEMLEALLGATR